MKYKYILFGLVIITFIVNSQTFNFYRTSPAVIYTNDTFGVISYGKVNNLTNTPNQIRIIRSIVNVPQGWESCLCDIVMCHPPGVDTAIANYPPGLSDIAVIFYTHSIPGTGYITYRAEKVSNTNEYYAVTFGGAYNPIGIIQINSIAEKFSLSQNYPNPFNPKTVISFQLAVNSFAELLVYDNLGKEITKLVNEQLQPGTYEVEFNGSNFSSGVYYYRLAAGDFIDTKKMILIK